MSMHTAYMMRKRAKSAMANGDEMAEMAKGGMVEGEDDDVVSRAMKRCYSEGGDVTGDDKILADFEPADYEVMPKDGDLDFSYTGSNSGDELGNEQEDQDEDDIVRRAFRSLAKKDRMPRPA